MKTSVQPNFVLQNNFTNIKPDGVPNSVFTEWIGSKRLSINFSKLKRFPENTELTWILNRNEILSVPNSLKMSSADLQGTFTTGVGSSMYPVIDTGNNSVFANFPNGDGINNNTPMTPQPFNDEVFQIFSPGKRDLNTGLLWVQASQDIMGEVTLFEMDWYKANEYCISIGLTLPTMRELLTLNNPGKWWTSTTYPGNQSQVMTIWTESGQWTQSYNGFKSELISKSTVLKGFYCVDYSSSYQFPYSITDMMDGTVKVKVGANSFYYWDKCKAGEAWTNGACSGTSTTDYLSASNFCNQKGIGWRIPSRNDFASIIDTSRINPPLNINFFPNLNIFPYSFLTSSYHMGGDLGNSPVSAKISSTGMMISEVQFENLIFGETKCVKGPLP